MVALRVNVHTPRERISISIPSTLYPTEAASYLLQLLRQHKSNTDTDDPFNPTYEEQVTDAPWQLSHLTQGPLHEDRTLFDNGVRDGDILLFDNNLHTAGVVRNPKPDPELVKSLTDEERLSEIRSSGRTVSFLVLAMLVLGAWAAAFNPSWWSVGVVTTALIIAMAFSMVVIYRQGNGDALRLGAASFALTIPLGLAIPPVHDALTLPTRLLISIVLLVFFIGFYHVLHITSIKEPSIAALLICSLFVLLGLILVEFTDLTFPSVGSTGLLIGCILLLGAARLALWIARVKVPITALMDIELPLFTQSSMDSTLKNKIRRARHLHSVLTISAVYLIVVSTLGVVQWPWAEHYDGPNVWQWILISLIIVAMLSTACHAIYRHHTLWLLAGTQIVFGIIALTVGVAGHPAGGFAILFLSLIVMGSLWLWVTQWSITPIVQKVIEVIEIIILSISLPIGIVANGLVPFLLSL